MALAFIVYSLLLLLLFSHSLIATRYEYTTPAYYLVCLSPVILFAVIIGLRYDVGLDYTMYMKHYSDVASHIGTEESYELLYEGINLLLGRLGLPVPALFITVSFIEMSLFFMSFSDKQELLPAAVLFYFITGQIFFDMNIMRHALATMVFIFSLRYVASGEFWKYLVCVLVATGFHSISAILIFVWFLRTPRKIMIDKPVLLIILFAATMIIGPYFTKLVIDPAIEVFRLLGYKNYVYLVDEWEMEINSGLGMYLLKFLDLATILIALQIKDKVPYKEFSTIIRVFIIGCLISNLFGLNMLLSRLPFSWTSVRIVLLPVIVGYAIKTVTPRFNLYRAASLIFVVGYTMSYIMNIVGGASKCSPFQFFNL